MNFITNRGKSIVIHTSRAANAEIELEFDNIHAACDWLLSQRNSLEIFANEHTLRVGCPRAKGAL